MYVVVSILRGETILSELSGATVMARVRPRSVSGARGELINFCTKFSVIRAIRPVSPVDLAVCSVDGRRV